VNHSSRSDSLLGLIRFLCYYVISSKTGQLYILGHSLLPNPVRFFKVVTCILPRNAKTLPVQASGTICIYAKFYSSFGCYATFSGHPTYLHFRFLGCHNIWSLQRRLCSLLFGSCLVTWTSRMLPGLARLPAPPKLWLETKDHRSI